MKRRRKAAIGVLGKSCLEMPRTPTLAQASGHRAPGKKPNLQLVSQYLLINHHRRLSLPWLCQAIIIYEEHSFIHHLPTQGKIYDAVRNGFILTPSFQQSEANLNI